MPPCCRVGLIRNREKITEKFNRKYRFSCGEKSKFLSKRLLLKKNANQISRQNKRMSMPLSA